VPILSVYVSEETLAQLNYHALHDEQGRLPVQLAEDCIAETAIRGLPLSWRDNSAATPKDHHDPQG
jgi:hypothetical protein